MRFLILCSLVAPALTVFAPSSEACYCSLLEVPKTVARAKAGGVIDATNPRTSHASSAPSISASSYCSIPDFEKALDRANAVFVGEVVEIIEPLTMDESAPLPGHFFTIRFKVERSWKGTATATGEIDVLSAQGKGICAYPPVRRGQKYLVYADPIYFNGMYHKEWNIITAASRTSLLNKAQSDICKLNTLASQSRRRRP